MPAPQSKPQESIPDCCRDCVQWNLFEKDCWVYWDLKKSCTMYVEDTLKKE